jgi:F0F1-type ATP synthase assembly protein I
VVEEAGSLCKKAQSHRRFWRNSMPQDQNTNWGSLAGVGLQIGVGVGLGCVVGWWLDKRYGWSPWGVVIGAMLGLASGMYLLFKEALKKQD